MFLLAIDALLHADRKQKLEAENIKLKDRIVNWRKYMAPIREQVEKVWRGCEHCTNSHARQNLGYQFCEHCGRPLTDEAVQMVMERLEALNDTEN